MSALQLQCSCSAAPRTVSAPRQLAAARPVYSLRRTTRRLAIEEKRDTSGAQSSASPVSVGTISILPGSQAPQQRAQEVALARNQ